MNRLLIAVLIALTAFPAIAWIVPDNSDDDCGCVQIHGFATVGLSKVDQNDVRLLRDTSTFYGASRSGDPFLMDSRAGLQVDWQIADRYSATVQGVYAPRSVQNLNQNIQWAFLKYSGSHNNEFRVGRVGADFFALSDQRNVGYTYPWVRPPVEFYGFMPIYSLDGADYQQKWELDKGYMTAKVFGGSSHPGFAENGPNGEIGTEFHLSPMVGLNVAWSDGHWTLRASHVRLTNHSSLIGLDPVLNDIQSYQSVWPYANTYAHENRLADTHVSYTDAGITYDSDHWFGMSEYSKLQFQSGLKAHTDAGYLTLGYHFHNWLPFVSYSRVWPSSNLDNVDPMSMPTMGLAMDTYIVNNLSHLGMSQNQYTESLGLRWDIRSYLDMKFQVDHTVEVDANNNQLWSAYQGNVIRPSGINTVSIALDWAF